MSDHLMKKNNNEYNSKKVSPPQTHSKSLFTSPPLAPLAFRVGIVGHRPDRLEKSDTNQLKQVLRSILSDIKSEVLSFSKPHKNLYNPSPPILRAISPLAEGADRLFAEQALDLEFELCCLMPFPQTEFEKDFQEGNALETDSLARFRNLLDRAEKETKLTRFELDGIRKTRGKAYGAAGRVVLNQSDILMVVWDGEFQGKIGGTEKTFREARNRGIPIVWVDACAPHSWQVLESEDSLPEALKGKRISPNGNGKDSLKKLIKNSIDLPSHSEPSYLNDDNTKDRPIENIKQKLSDFYAEIQPYKSIAIIWKGFRDIFGDSQTPDVTFEIKPFEDDVIEEWPRNHSSPLSRIVDWLRPFYAWPDKLAVIYSDRYRSAFILVFLLAALAVGFCAYSDRLVICKAQHP